MKFLQNEPLAKHTYFKIGGPADLFATANSTQEVIELVQYALDNKLSYLVLGSGSNILVSDQGFRGLVIKNRSNKIQLKGFTGQANKGKVDLKEIIVQADSGVPANQLIRYTLDEGLAGLEEFLGLPGTVGGAVYNNSHHLGKLIGDLIVEVSALNQKGELYTLQPKELKFAYDYSVFHDSKDTILTASFQLKKGNKEALWQLANAAVKRRSTTQPLGVPSSGCIFQNIKVADAMRLGTPGGTCSAGYLIDKAGLKGESIGEAQVSALHANFIVNSGEATAQNILTLIKVVKDRVKAKFGVDLREEIVLVGELN